uniref:Hemocytin n=1 Tax=Dendroctonus ponderosae TaxID=77166 RepID=A0AAR5QHC1_DENPD
MGVLSFCALALLAFSIQVHHTRGQSYIPQFLKSKYTSLDTTGNAAGAKPESHTGYGGQSYVEEGHSFGESASIPVSEAHSYLSGGSYGGGGGGGFSNGGYGGSFSASGSLSSDSHGALKTKTKTKTKTKSKTGKYSGGCGSAPPSPMNAGMRCSSYGGCRADCIPEYQFPNGKTQLSIVCQNENWKVADEPSWATVPSCQPICLPECINNGICLAPNQCQCPENFGGPQCQFENKPCLNLPVLPRNSKRSCRAKQCTIECLPGHQFPDGSSIATLICNNGFWLPGKAQWAAIPDCKATCVPPCLNGGSCLSYNVCQCPQDFRGPQCQYSASVCSAKNMQFNGGYNCSGDMDSFSCAIFCPEGIAFEFVPEAKYTCFYSTGQFFPSPQPQCIFPEHSEVISHGSSSQEFHSGEMYHIGGQSRQQNSFTRLDNPEEEFEIFRHKSFRHNVEHQTPETIINQVDQLMVVPTSGYEAMENNFVDLVPKPGSCYAWGGSHYKTFDGKIYSFESRCSHVLLKDAIDNTFSVLIRNHPDCFKGVDPSKCHKVIKVFVQGKEYFLKRSEQGLPIFASAKKILPIPGHLPGLRVNIAGNFVVLSMDSMGLVLKWDGKQLLHVEVQESLWNRTEGLCGKIDGDKRNDLLTKEGHLSKSIATLASSWQVDDLEDPCNDTPREEHACSGYLEQEAADFCGKILSDPRFAACLKSMDLTGLLDSCKWDYCSCKESDKSTCTCETLEVYVKDCSHKGVKTIVQWRDEKTCPMKCTGGKVYMPCGPKNGQPMCGTVSMLPEDDDSCNEGCYCPEGTVLHENRCITKEQCPCKLRGKKFDPGASIPKDCNTCTCSNGQWDCTQVFCGARCAAVGDPHYVTFDGKVYDFMGQCSYYLVKTDELSIEAENIACAGSISQAMNFPASVSAGLPSCTKTVTIRISGQVIKLKQNHEVVVNGADVTKIPYNVSGSIIRAVSSIFLQVELPNGIEVWWDGVSRAYIDLPASFKGKTRGLCGTFNNNQKDDFVTPENDVEQSVIPFANKWKTLEKCNDVPDVLSAHPCDVNLHHKPTAERHCAKIKSDLFKACHWFVDPEQFYQNCLYDMCSCEYQVSRCLCPTVSAYATECSRKGIKIDWRNEVRECGIHCPGGQKYQVCGNSCTRTCSDLFLRPDCKPQCVEGCNCPDGEALEDNGECIPIGQCKCQQDGLEFQAGYKEIRQEPRGLELCTCLNGLWRCKLATVQEIQSFPKANDLKAKWNFEFTTCEDVEPVTCKNMHTNEHFSPTVCHSGCKCKNGYVLDSKNRKCVKPADCPCHHGGRSYKEKSTVQSDCNTCTCKNGKWQCTDRQCTAECSAWGDSHYKTFDGKHFDYQGQCDFVLAKGSLGSDSFDVTIQNVPCGSLGTSCSKSVTLRCVFDACACDQGGDCECLCTALAAYAQECNNRGAPVNWRSQLLCPMQCDRRCSLYKPCISTCPFETCDNLMTNSKLTKSCSEDACVEGCSPKVCPPDFVYLNESYAECVPRNTCKPVCMELDGVTYYEGDLMEEDDCHSCFCSRGEKICKGQTCMPTEPPTLTTLQHEQDIQCVSGWTDWINQDKKALKNSGKEKVKLQEVEPLPMEIILNNMRKNASKCDANHMVAIECLTVDGRQVKELGLDVECSLEKGLIC